MRNSKIDLWFWWLSRRGFIIYKGTWCNDLCIIDKENNFHARIKSINP